MKKTFADFISNNPNYSGFCQSVCAKRIFDILSKDKNIIKMLEYADAGIPPLFACVKDIESAFDAFTNPDFDLNKNFDRQGLGRMVKTILEPFGYIKVEGSKKSVPKDLNAKYIKNASRFKYDETAPRTMLVVKTIEKI